MRWLTGSELYKSSRYTYIGIYRDHGNVGLWDCCVVERTPEYPST